MKKIVLFLFVVCFIPTIKAQIPISGNPYYTPFSSFGNDSVSYLKTNFEANKAFYTGKTLNVLANDLELIPICVIYSRDNTSSCRGITLYYRSFDRVTWNLVNKLYLFSITIDFMNSIPRNEFDSFISANRDNGMLTNWSNIEKSFYGTRVIKNISVSEINK